MPDWCEKEIQREHRAHKKRWNGKVIDTDRQWSNNADGSCAISSCSDSKIWDAVRDYYDSRQW